MSSKRFWKPVWIGAVILAALGFGFATAFMSLASCPGYSLACVPSAKMFFAEVLFFGWPTIIGGAMAGALIGMIYAVLHRGAGKGPAPVIERPC